MPSQRLVPRLNATVVVVALVVTALDALSKLWARRELTHHAIHVAGSVWLRLQFNSGASFSFDQSGPAVVTVVTVLIALAVVVVGLQARPGAPAIGFGLLIGGGVANVLDRLSATPHRVTDFIALGGFPVFNLADVAVTCGFIVLVIAALSGQRLIGR